MLNDNEWQYGFMDYTRKNYLEKCQERPSVHETYAGLDDDVYAKLMQAKQDNPFNRKDNVDLLENHMSLDWRAVLENTEIQTTFFVAKESPYYREGYEKWLKQRNMKIDSLIMSPSGHVIMAEIPKQFNNKLGAIL